MAKLPRNLAHLKHLVPRESRPLAQSEFVYVVACHEYVKIGIAVNVAHRIAGMQTGNPYEIVLIGWWRSNDAPGEEEAIHAHWDKYRVRGEWFRLPKSLMDTIAIRMQPEELRRTMLPNALEPL